MKSIPWLSLLLAPAVVLAAADPLPEFRHTAEIALEGRGAFYALELPEAFYRGVARSDLGDLRVLNGAGEVVPHALLRAPSTERRASAPLATPLLPLYGPPGAAGEQLALRLERRRDGSVKAFVASRSSRATPGQLLGYVIDASAATLPLRALRFDWPAGAEGSTLEVRVEASDDLQSWRGVGEGRLLVLRQGELVLERREVALTPTKAKYFRVLWRSAPEGFALTAVAALTVDESSQAKRMWTEVAGIATGKPGEYAFELPAGLSVDRLRFALPQENTVVAATVLLQERPGAAARVLKTATLYRMQHQGEHLTNPELEVPPTLAPRWLLQVDARGGGLGSGAPVMQAGWLPQRLVFVARGEPPFRAVFGSAEARSSAQAVQTIVPGYKSDEPLTAFAARLGEIRSVEPRVKSAAEVVQDYFARMDEKKLWLWLSLLAAVAVILAMGWRLTRQLPHAGDALPPRPPHEMR